MESLVEKKTDGKDTLTLRSEELEANTFVAGF